MAETTGGDIHCGRSGWDGRRTDRGRQQAAAWGRYTAGNRSNRHAGSSSPRGDAVTLPGDVCSAGKLGTANLLLVLYRLGYPGGRGRAPGFAGSWPG
ncbi:hypothetical protein [Amycolatopsis panacis]|uniref:hypothetical protein n=1 Tax=Amycolatopsis panacis TaxID=2340917 RepID=UPI0011C39926|nr:hypothetical protein [Amycolatopsis panacis]